MLARRFSFLLLWLLPTIGWGQTNTLPSSSETVQFNRDIRPILSDNCFHCHGPDQAQRQADLRLDREEDAFAKPNGVTILQPGKPEKSELYRRIVSQDEGERMPPSDSGRSLSPRERELIRQWISQGAKWQSHWSLIRPSSPRIPDVKTPDWCNNPIDRFVLARLERESLSPSSAADPNRLLRRVTLDLTGLPPTPDEVDAFLADTKPGAYGRLVDRLLASPRYGERMAMNWLDAARYADTSGYQSDGPREMWRWRDWVIEAFNGHQDFDQFTIEQLAGDLLPHPTLPQRIATGFNRNHRGNAEGGIIPEEYACEYVVDRVETTFTVWLGLTMGCARCHDHKFDPLSQRDFYEAYAYFNNILEFGRALKEGNSPPLIKAPTDHQQRQLQQLEERLHQAEMRWNKLQKQVAKAQQTWEKEFASEDLQWFPTRDLLVHYPMDGDLRVIGLPPIPIVEDQIPEFTAGQMGQAAQYAGHGTELVGLANFGYFDKFSFSFWIKPAKPTGTVLSKTKDTARAEGYAVQLENGHLQVNLVKRWLDDAIRVETAEALPLNEWQHVAVTYDGSRVAKGIKVYLNGKPVKMTVKLDLINQSFATEEPFRIGQGGGPDSGFHGLLDDLRIYKSCLSEDTIELLSVRGSITEILAIAKNRRSPAQKQKLRNFFLEQHAPKDLQAAWKQRNELHRRRAEWIESFPTVMVMQEKPHRTPTYILKRGQYDQPGEAVERNVPECLPPMPENLPNNRLGFAKWLVDEKNPLTARVAVNRLWQMSFGTGLVKTQEDFGSQGEPPSHPELLDWLATELIKRDWNLQEIQRLIVTSATYRQSSKVSVELLERDPDNRLLARGPRFRLSAAMIRDQALAASGLLAERLGGPSVKPYQPAGLWTELANEKPYQHDHGESLYRRSLYTFWKRTIGPPGLLAFDASTRETCRVRPTRTNTPLQSLNLMNDVIFVEASRKLAARVLIEGGHSQADRLRYLFRLVLSREPQPKELAILTEALSAHQQRYQKHPQAAKKLLSVGESPADPRLDASEHAAYTTLASLILNLDEAVTRE